MPYSLFNFVGVYLSINGRSSMNNSDVTVTDIGDGKGGVGGALLCYTDNIQCCNETAENTGRWFQAGPGGGDVGDDGDLYVTRGPNVVRLHRRNNTFPVGVLCCEVPDSRSRSQTLCIHVGKFVNLLNLRYNFSHQSLLCDIELMRAVILRLKINFGKLKLMYN